LPVNDFEKVKIARERGTKIELSWSSKKNTSLNSNSSKMQYRVRNRCGTTCSLDASFVGVTARSRGVTSCLLLTPWEYYRQLVTVLAAYFPGTCNKQPRRYPQIYGTHTITHIFSSVPHVNTRPSPHYVTTVK
jgi:hypothetical protein